MIFLGWAKQYTVHASIELIHIKHHKEVNGSKAAVERWRTRDSGAHAQIGAQQLRYGDSSAALERRPVPKALKACPAINSKVCMQAAFVLEQVKHSATFRRVLAAQ